MIWGRYGRKTKRMSLRWFKCAENYAVDCRSAGGGDLSSALPVSSWVNTLPPGPFHLAWSYPGGNRNKKRWRPGELLLKPFSFSPFCPQKQVCVLFQVVSALNVLCPAAFSVVTFNGRNLCLSGPSYDGEWSNPGATDVRSIKESSPTSATHKVCLHIYS